MPKKLLTIFFRLLLLLIFFLTVFVHTANAQGLPVFYDFEDWKYTDWNIMSGNWSVQDKLGSKRFGASIQNIPNSSVEARIGDSNWTNYEINLDILPTGGTDRNFAFRATSSRTQAFNLDLPVAYALHMSTSYIHLQKFVQKFPGDNPNNIEHPVMINNRGIPDNSPTHFQIKLQANNIKVFINDEQTQVIDWTDTSSNPILSGNLALIITTGGDPNSEVWFDNVSVKEITSPTPLPLPSLDVPDLKQYDVAWGNQIYDHLNATIKQFGCALTSASMVLQYFGHSWADPAALNNWLNLQPDGYLRNGLLNWMAVSRYTFLNDSPSSPTLEYRRIAPTNNNLLYELENNRPAILKEPGHFIVAKSQTSDSFGINDPAYVDRTTLASYGNTFFAINSYRPTDTDLSYILLAIDDGNTVKVYQPNGTEIIEFTFTEEPLVDDIGGSEKSGETLTLFQYPAPVGGEYKVEVTGPLGSYTLDSYLYDIDGLVTTDSHQGLIKEGQTDNFTLSFGGESPSIVPVVTIDTLIDDLNNAYSQGLITKRNIYLSLKYQFQGVKKLLQKNKTASAKRRLSHIKSFIARITPRYIKQPASDILRNNIEAFISSL